MTRMKPPSDDSTPDVPDALKRDLSQLAKARVFVPDDVDQAVLDHAQQHLHKARSARRWPLKHYASLAAMVLVATALWMTIWLQDDPAQPVVTLADINVDGRVDIVDALLLAQQINQAETSLNRAAADVNHDGLINRDDVDAIAMMAVRLHPTSGGS